MSKTLLFLALLLAVFLLGCVQRQEAISTVSQTPASPSPTSSQELPAEVVEVIDASDGLDEALEELREAG